MKVFIKIVKFIAGTAIGLTISFLIIIGLDSIISLDITKSSKIDLWLIGGSVSVCVFLCNYLFFIGSSCNSKNIQTEGIELLPQSISELIDGIIDAMRYRRSVRADVRQELTDHFTDSLANCQTEEEKQEATKTLIEEFGDIELLGKLLRRAKKRCRPLWRTMVVRFCQLIGICFALLILYIGWFFTGKPQVTTNYLEVMNQKVRPVADDSQNAWPFYKQAAEKGVEFKDNEFDFHPTTPSPFTRSDEDKEIIRQSIRDNQQSLDLIRQGNQKPYYWVVHDTDESENLELLSILMPHLGSYRDLARLMCWQGLLSAEQGDFGKALDDLLNVYSFGHHLHGQGMSLIEQLVAMRIEEISSNTLNIILRKYVSQIDSTILHLTRKQYEAMIDNKDFIVNLEGNKLLMFDEAQRCFIQSRFGKSHLYLKRLRDIGCFTDSEDIVTLFGMQPFHILFTHPDKEETLREVERLYSKMEKIAVMTPASAKSQGLDLEEISRKAMNENVFLSFLVPELERLNQIAWRVRVQSYATLVVLALVQYEKQNGQFPESLDILVEKNLLKEIPIDPFSDESLVYRKTDNDFILYSVGSNFTDDGGIPAEYESERRNKNPQARKWGPNGDAVFWPVELQ